ncbi:MAG: RnfABCDGE type electron transport complex subunit G [Sphingobacteriia bacterium]|nr:RnfABCDGE type electron transport complex subunit G [Sphingobacteriia bacterium]
MAKKLESTFINMFLTLLIVTAISSLAAGVVYQLTKEPIAEVARQKQQKAIEQVLPGFTDTRQFSVMPETGSDSLIFYEGSKDGEVVGVAVNTYTQLGYSGLIKIMVGFKPDGTLVSYEVLEHKETPGLGSKASDASFKDQFKNQNLNTFKLKVAKDGGDVDAITAATITSRAVCDAIQRAYDAYGKVKNQPNEIK